MVKTFIEATAVSDGRFCDLYGFIIGYTQEGDVIDTIRVNVPMSLNIIHELDGDRLSGLLARLVEESLADFDGAERVGFSVATDTKALIALMVGRLGVIASGEHRAARVREELARTQQL